MSDLMTAVLASVREVPFQIWDLVASPTPGLEPGFYYNVPLPEDAKAHPTEIFLEGPFPSRQAAYDAAAAFVQDALSDHNEAEPHPAEN